MRRGIVGKLMLTGAGALLACGLSAGAALASPTCTTVNDLGASGQGVIAKSSFTAGYCVRANDKLYGNFNIASLPASTVVIFNLNTIGANDYYQIAFSGPYSAGTTPAGHVYNWSYEVAVFGAPPGTVIVELDADFTQTAGGPSVLNETITPAGNVPIHEVKVGAVVQPGYSTQTFFTPGATNLLVNLHLVDKGTISSVTNTIVQFVPSRNDVPEPLTLSLFGAGLAGLGMARRKRRG